MIDKGLIKHAREFQGHMDSGRFEVTEQGILFPTAGAFIHGEYTYRSNGGDMSVESNLLTVEGMNHILMVALSNTAKLNNFYLSLFGGNYTPVDTLTAASYPATAAEITSGTEGYSEAARPQWVPNAAANGAIDSVGNEAVFTIQTASSLVIRGAALTSSATKGGTTGTLISISRFSADRTQYQDDIVELGYRVRLK